MKSTSKPRSLTKVFRETASGWGCPHELAGTCDLRRTECQPGLAGCVLYGLVTILGKTETGHEPERSDAY